MHRVTTTAAGTSFILDRRKVLHLGTDQSVSVLGVEDTTWTRPAAVPVFGDGRVLSVFDYAASWTRWERHPVGAEVVQILSGALVFHLDDGTSRTSVPLAQGRGLVVPEGVWHRAECTAPTIVLFVTPTPALTEHRGV